ncbi:MAG: HupE/UreJ family protein [Kiloniellales bacterium]
MKKVEIATLSLVTLAVTMNAAVAHTGFGPTSGLMAGFAHPLLGLDHVLAMTAVGALAAQAGGRTRGRALWALPLAFMSAMALGALAAIGGFGLSYVELGIAGSVLALGALIAFEVRLPTAILAAVIALFAIFHGHAHGSELPAAAGAVDYALGFLGATALLHGVGLLLGLALNHFGATALRLAGGGTAAVGLVLLLN